jgi:hypothetical protein
MDHHYELGVALAMERIARFAARPTGGAFQPCSGLDHRPGQGPAASVAAASGRHGQAAWPWSQSAASTPTADQPEAAMHPIPTPTRRPRIQSSQRLRATKQRQRGRRPTMPIDRRTPSGRLLPYWQTAPSPDEVEIDSQPVADAPRAGRPESSGPIELIGRRKSSGRRLECARSSCTSGGPSTGRTGGGLLFGRSALSPTLPASNLVEAGFHD